MRRTPLTRAGSVLIVVAGLTTLLATLALAFYVRMRGDVEESLLTMRDAQARIMLMAACSYLQEASRIGWETTSAHEECFGWVDVRDGSLGPKVTTAERSDAHRFPMYVMNRPPYAVQLTAAYNPIRTPVSPNPLPTSDAKFGMPYLTNPDPQPVAANGWAGFPGATVSATPAVGAGASGFSGPDSYASGDRRPRAATTGRSWFRIWRDGPATFVVTCGAGGTLGYRDWSSEIAGDPQASAQFNDDARLFDELRANEVRTWYRVEWNGAVLSPDYHMMDHSLGRDVDHYMVWPLNASHSTAGHEYRTQMHAVNQGGTILWVQRLRDEPTNW